MFEQNFKPPGPEDEVEFLPILSFDEDSADDKQPLGKEIPLLPVKNTVLFPGVVIPITVGRDKSLKAIKAAFDNDKMLVVAAQKDASAEEPKPGDLHEVATVARIVKRLRMPDGSSTVIIQGNRRVKLESIVSDEPYFKVTVSTLPDTGDNKSREFKALIASLKDIATEVIKLSPHIPTEASIILRNIDNARFLIHFIASNLNAELKEKQEILEANDLQHRAELVLKRLNSELQQLELQNKIQSKVRTDIEKQQRDYFLNQQLKTIREELGGDSFDKEVERLKEKAKEKKWNAKTAETFQRELEKLQRINPAAAEYSVMLNYLDTLVSLPWGDYTKDDFDLKRAQKVLDQDHFGLEKVKDRIMEYLAVLKLKGDMKSPILCFVGPPGVGKTSLGKSIARALKRKYVRMSLGGVHDEAEIRGHRKTYIGAMPGRVVQSLKKVQSSNPVFILDEIDKVGADYRGDPSSALLEVLDPEQNSTFYDNYLELEYDLSKVLFIATANTIASIQPALRDRMEVINLEGYSVEEKIEIATGHLVPKQREAHGLKATQVKLGKKTLAKIIQDYTLESGVRELERQIASVMRNRAKTVALGEARTSDVTPEEVEKILGALKYDRTLYNESLPPGVAVGLAYTPYGGDILFIESALSAGKGRVTLTGNLGEVMKESANTAFSFLKSKAEKLGLDPKEFEKYNIHIHVPEGATPKDGPSAGVTMLTSITSAFSGRKLKSELAMTGEITLRGKVLPVGGIKEKILAAKRAGIKNIIMPDRNKKDVEKIKSEYIKGLKISYVKDMMEVIELALEKKAKQTVTAVN
jgi:ATP-dependent Lon protease